MNSIIHYLFAWYLSVFLVNSQQIDTSFCDINLIPANPANLTPPDVIFTDRYKAVVDKIENNAKFGENIIELLDLNENIGVAKTSTPFLTARSFCYYSTNEILSIIDDECKVSKLNEAYQFLTPFFLITINGEEHIVSPLSLLFELAGSFQFVYIGDSEFVRGIPVREWQTCIFTRDAAERITYSFSDPTKWSPASLNPFDSKYKSVPVQVLINRKDENGTISEIVYSITQFKPYFDFDESEYYTPPGVYCPGRIQGPHIPELPKAFQVSRELVLPPTPDIPDSKGTVISFRESYDYEYILFKFTFVNGSELTTRIHDFLTGLQYEFNDETSECRVTKLSKNIQDDNIYFDFNKVDYQYTGKRIVDGVNTDVWIGPKTINGENVYFEWHFLADGWIRTDQAGDNDQVTPILLVVHFIPSTPTAPKRQKVLELPSVIQRWTEKKGTAPTKEDIERIYNKSLTATLDVLPANSHVIEGVAETINLLRSKYGIKIGSSTGYTKEIMAMLKPLASEEGYTPDAYVTSDEVVTARPSPSMIYLNMIRLDVWNAKAVVKVDDTDQGIIAGLHAGCWTVGVAKTGNYVGATEEELKAMDPDVLKSKVAFARKSLFECGSHFVVDTVNELPEVIEEINRRLASGLSP